jgi:hypothetical protein
METPPPGHRQYQATKATQALQNAQRSNLRASTGSTPTNTQTEAEASNAPDRRRTRRKSGYWPTVVVLALAAALGGYLWFSEPPVTDDEQARIQAEYQQTLAAWGGAVPLERVADQDRERAIAAMGLPSEVARRLSIPQQQFAQSSDRSDALPPLAWIELWDIRAEDGDRIIIDSDGVKVKVQLFHQRNRIAIPMPQSGFVTIEGVYDGGGGITIGIQSGRGQIRLPHFPEGGRLKFPVTPV